MEKERIEILLMEDDPAEGEMIREMLISKGEHRFSVRQVRYLAQALGLLKERDFDCVLVDLGHPDSHGLETALAVRSQAKTTPIIILTGQDDEELTVKALQLDIQDYLVKGEITSALLKRSVRYAIQRKHDSEMLRRSEQRFVSFMHHLPAAAWIKDLEGRYVYANPEAERIFSRSLSEIFGRSDFELFPPETARLFSRNDRRVLDEGNSLQTMETLLQSDGIEHQSVVSKFSIPGPDGQPEHVAGVALDITEHKRMEEALHESEVQYRTLFDSIDEGFCIVEVIFDENDRPVDYRFLETNPSFGQQTGLIDAQGKRMRELAPKHEEYWFEIYGRIAATGEPARFQNRAEQLHRWYDVYAFPYGQPEKRQLAILFNDITPRIQAEAEINKLNADLAARIADLEMINHELDAFNRTVSHDLRLPLNTISMSSQAIGMLCGAVLDEQCREYLRIIHDGVLRMNELISSLLRFSLSTHGELHRGTLDLSAMAQDVAERLRLAEPERRVSFWIEDGLTANGDASLIRVVLENLMGNAWKYTAMREEALIEFGAMEIDGRAAWFVRDNGNGFSMEYADMLFAPFQRMPNAEEFKGFGIGLATVERIILRHGGRIWAEGKPDRGATFWFTLPEKSMIK